MWYNTQLRIKPDKVVVKLRNNDGSFDRSIIAPTDRYPLTGTPEIFHANCTEFAENEKLFEAIDTVRYQIGHCYTNASGITAALKSAGFDAVSYVGWLFVGEQIPIHHCWTVVGGNMVIDLCDDLPAQIDLQPDLPTLQGDALKAAFADFVRKTRDWPNSHRCYPLGRPNPNWLYVGCPCEPVEGVKIWNRLMEAYPKHECQRTVGNTNMSKTQLYLHEQGLM